MGAKRSCTREIWTPGKQAEGGVIDARTDIFAFGVVLYEMLTGGL